jgi:hypothetical protein
LAQTPGRRIAELIGHRTIQMTMRYAHLAPAHNQEAVEKLVSPSKKVVTKSATPTTAKKARKNKS